MALIQNWISNTSFDEELSKIHHYAIHPEMKPFIGTHYNKSGILLVGESHFYEHDKKHENILADEKRYIEEKWYLEPTPEIFSYKNNFNTRAVIHNYLTHKRTKAHSMFRNPAQCVIDIYNLNNIVSDSEAFNAFAFMNYYQKPALTAHESINDNSDDVRIANDTFVSVCNTIKPKTVIFLSKKAYNCYKDNKNNLSLACDIDFVYHPTCAYWNNKDGKEKFERILSRHKEDISFLEYKLFQKEDILNSIQKSKYVLKLPKQKRFIEDITTLRLYGDDDSIYELAVHIVTNAGNVGVGYNAENQAIWIWDYNEKEYIDENDFDKYNGLEKLHAEFTQYIERL